MANLISKVTFSLLMTVAVTVCAMEEDLDSTESSLAELRSKDRVIDADIEQISTELDDLLVSAMASEGFAMASEVDPSTLLDEVSAMQSRSREEMHDDIVKFILKVNELCGRYRVFRNIGSDLQSSLEIEVEESLKSTIKFCVEWNFSCFKKEYDGFVERFNVINTVDDIPRIEGLLNEMTAYSTEGTSEYQFIEVARKLAGALRLIEGISIDLIHADFDAKKTAYEALMLTLVESQQKSVSADV